MVIKDLLVTSREFDKSKRDYLLDTKEFDFGVMNCNFQYVQTQLSLAGVPRPYVTSVSMTDWALRQVCLKLEGHPPSDYMKRCPSMLRAYNLNDWRIRTDRRMLVRIDGEKARAFLSEKYSAIGNTTVLELADEMLVDVPYELYDSVITPDVTHVRILIADHPGGNYRIGCYISNGEIGNMMIRVLPLVQRTTCKNSVIFADGGFIQRHLAVSYPFLRGAIKEHIGQALNMSVTYVGMMVEAELKHIPDIKDVINRICYENGFSQNVHDDIMRGTEGQSTVMAVANGLSFAAHGVENPDESAHLELMAGLFLTNREHVLEGVGASIEE